MTRLTLVAGLVVLVGCGSSDHGKKDASPPSADTGTVLTPDLGAVDTGLASDVAANDTSAPDVAAFETGQDVPAGDTSAPDAPIADAATPDAAADLALDVAADLAPDVTVAADTALTPDAVAMCGNIKCDCTFEKNGKTFKLYGKYRVDDIFPDFTVREVTFNEDLKVRKVDFFPDTCGKWQRDDIFYDFKVRIVTFNEDSKIRYVDFNEGIR